MTHTATIAGQKARTGPSPAQPDGAFVAGGRLPAMDLRWLIGLLAIDLSLMAVHVILGATLPTIPPVFNIAFDHSLGEQLNYAKWAAVIAALFIAARQGRMPVLFALSAVFLMVFLDDSMQIHESVGAAIADGRLLPGLGLAGSQDMGELVVVFGYGLVLGPVLLAGYLATDPAARGKAWPMVGLLALLTVFAAGVDQMHGLFRGLPYGIQIADLVEDGGEMLVGSAIVAHAVALMRRATAR